MNDVISRLQQALGTRYEIVEQIGEGAMALVFRARETKHDREVAIKVLRVEVAAAVGASRFLKEIQVTARLGHPHILPLLDSGEADGFLYFAMPLAEGESLAARIGREGPLPIDEALRITADVADALSYAHQHDVVHRDIKPANILLEAGNAMVADFGVAMELDEALTQKLTSTGMSPGTPLYMSPEQSDGDGPVDGRSDIYALGCVLYEMLTGEPPYMASSARAIAVKRFTEPVPSPRRFRASIPAEVDRAVMRALQPTPADRFQTAAEFAEVLTGALSRFRAGVTGEEPMASSVGGGIAAPPATQDAGAGRRGAIRLRRWGLGLLAVAAVALAVVYGLPRIRAFIQARQTLGEATFTQVTTAPGAELFPSLSADGSIAVFSRYDDIFLRHLSTGSERALTHDPDQRNTQPALSPDGTTIAFRSEREGGGIFLMDTAGRNLRRITNFGFNPAWAPDGKSLVFAYEGISVPTTRHGVSNLYTVTLPGDQPRKLEEMDAVQPRWSPHGLRIAFWSIMRDGKLTGQRDIWTVAADGSDPVPVTSDEAVDWSPTWSADGRFLLFSSDRGGSMNIWSVRVDEATGKVLGPPRPVTRGGTGSEEHVAVAADGRTALYADRTTTANIWRVAFDPVKGVIVGKPQAVTRGSNMAQEPSVSPDGKQVTWYTLGKDVQLYVGASDGSGAKRLSTPPAHYRSPQWSPDGSRIAFHSDRGGTFQIWEVDPEGKHFTQVSQSASVAIYPFWSPHGKRLGWVELGRGLVQADPDHPSAGAETILSGDVMVRPQWSPDGRKIAGVLSPNAGGSGIVIYDVAAGSMETVSRFGDAPLWLPDSERLVFVNGNRLYLADSRTRTVREIMSGGRDLLGLGSLTRDGRWLYFTRQVTDGDLWRISWK